MVASRLSPPCAAEPGIGAELELLPEDEVPLPAELAGALTAAVALPAPLAAAPDALLGLLELLELTVGLLVDL